MKETIIPAGANKVLFLLAPMLTFTLALVAWAVIPFDAGLGDRRHQCRHALPLRDLVAGRLRHHHGGLGVELEIRLPGRAALGGADGVYEVSIGFVIITVLLWSGSLNLSDIVEAQAAASAAASTGAGQLRCCSRCS
jgi:NADH-quinone oxidoreductase subunit H